MRKFSKHHVRRIEKNMNKILSIKIVCVTYYYVTSIIFLSEAQIK